MFGLFKKEQEWPSASILVIEDSAADRMIIQRTLEKKNYSVIVAHDGESGLKLVHEHKVDLIILDYLLPGRNGIEICRIIKGSKETRDIPVIFLTVVEAGETILECYGAGAETYIHKPIDAGFLLKEVKSLLSEAKHEGGDD